MPKARQNVPITAGHQSGGLLGSRPGTLNLTPHRTEKFFGTSAGALPSSPWQGSCCVTLNDASAMPVGIVGWQHKCVDLKCVFI